MSGVVGPRLSTIPPTFQNTYSMEFDGVNDYVSVPDVPALRFGAGDFTISTWFKAPSPPDFRTIISKGNDTGGGGFQLYLRNDSTIRFYYDTTFILTDSTNPFDNAWHHLVVTRIGTALVMYVDNSSVDTSSPTLKDFSSTDPLRIGARSTLQNDYLGNIDELSLWNKGLSSSEVSELYNNGTPANLASHSSYSNAISWWRMGENAVFRDPQWLIPSNENKDKVSNYSFDFDGVDSRIQLSSDFVASAEFTISFWMKPVSAGSPISEIYPIGTFPGNDNYVKLDQIGVMWLRLGGANAIFNEAVYGGGANNLVLDTWQNIVFIRDSSNIIRCYRNGVDFGYNVAAATNSNTLTLNSFGRIITNTFGFEGGLDYIAFWNSDETANISTIYNGGEPTTLPSGGVAHYKMGEDATFSGGVWVVPDQVGSNDGASVNMGINDRVGYASGSENNALSYNMVLSGRTSDVPT